MRILVVSNLYPPHVIGGYELGCRDVVEALRARGHDVHVLTSRYVVSAGGARGTEREGEVSRALTLDWGWPRAGIASRVARTLRREVGGQRAVKQLLRAWCPDAVYIWNPAGLPMGCVTSLIESGIPVHFFVSDGWLAGWRPAADAWLRLSHPERTASIAARTVGVACRLLGRSLGIPLAAPRFERAQVQFCSAFLERQARASHPALRTTRTIHWGVDTARFQPPTTPRPLRGRLLYVGQVVRHKGVHTAVEALRLLRDEYGRRDVHLDLVGATTTPDYVEQIRRQVDDAKLGARVTLHGGVPREQLPALYRDHDVLLFPSAWDEPFSITLVEALAAGLAVVSTSTGGTSEIVRDGENALLFATEDARDCARQLDRLLGDPALASRLRAEARRVASQFDIARMVDQVERSLGDRLPGVAP